MAWSAVATSETMALPEVGRHPRPHEEGSEFPLEHVAAQRLGLVEEGDDRVEVTEPVSQTSLDEEDGTRVGGHTEGSHHRRHLGDADAGLVEAVLFEVEPRLRELRELHAHRIACRDGVLDVLTSEPELAPPACKSARPTS